MTPLASITATSADAVAREIPSLSAMSPRDSGLIASRSRIRALIRKPQPSAAHYRNSSKFLEGETVTGCSDISCGVWCDHPGKRVREQDIFARKDLPLFRVQAIVRREGLDADGRASMIQVRPSHALLEGSSPRGITTRLPFQPEGLLPSILGNRQSTFVRVVRELGVG